MCYNLKSKWTDKVSLLVSKDWPHGPCPHSVLSLSTFIMSFSKKLVIFPMSLTLLLTGKTHTDTEIVERIKSVIKKFFIKIISNKIVYVKNTGWLWVVVSYKTLRRGTRETFGRVNIRHIKKQVTTIVVPTRCKFYLTETKLNEHRNVQKVDYIHSMTLKNHNHNNNNYPQKYLLFSITIKIGKSKPKTTENYIC